MRLSNLADYAVLLMTAAAGHCGGVRTSAATLAQESGVPLATAHKLVHALVRGGLLKSVRGAGGGVRLARPAAAISIADIIEAVEGPIAVTSCSVGERCQCGIAPACSVRAHWPHVNRAVKDALGQVMLSSFTRSVAA